MFTNAKIIACLFLLMGMTPLTASAQEFTVEQKDKMFMYNGKNVSTLALKVGDAIKFKNNDTVFHNIISLSKIMNFNLGTFDKGKSKTVTFNKAGTVHVECAIHPRMMLEVMVGK